MFCHECGKQNPEGAKFCAFCGTRMADPTALAAARPAESTQEPRSAPAPAKSATAEPAARPDPHQPFKRPAGDDVRPVAENPAQPARGEPRPTPAAPSPAAPTQNTQPQAAVRKPQPGPQRAMTASGGEVMPPSRAPNVKKPGRYDGVSHRQPGASPFAQVKGKLGARPDADEDDDLFFEDDDEPDDVDEDRVVRHLKSIIAVLFLALVVGTLGWLFFSHSGALFRASIGVAAPAEAYFELGAQKEASNELKGAAEAYYSALKLDPTNYVYSLQVGKAYERIGDDDTAIKAYQSCITLRDNLPEPYALLASVLERTGNAEAAGQWRRMGYDKTGDASLLEQQDPRANQHDIIDPVPAMPAG